MCPSPGGLWSVFTLGGAGSKAGIDQEHNPLPLSNQSLLLLLVLANLTDGPDWPNPYRQAITCFRNTQGNIFVYLNPLYIFQSCSCVWHVPEGNDVIKIILLIIFTHLDTSSLSVEQPHTFQINFNSLYTALCEQQRSDQATLLLYTLLHQNTNMRTYMLSRTDMDNLVGGMAMKTIVNLHTCMHIHYSCLSLTFCCVVYWQGISKAHCMIG